MRRCGASHWGVRRVRFRRRHEEQAWRPLPPLPLPFAPGGGTTAAGNAVVASSAVASEEVLGVRGESLRETPEVRRRLHDGRVAARHAAVALCGRSAGAHDLAGYAALGLIAVAAPAPAAAAAAAAMLLPTLQRLPWRAGMPRGASVHPTSLDHGMPSHSSKP